MRSDAVKDILTDLNTVLASYNYYNEVAPGSDNVSFPYVTSEVNNSFSDGEGTETFIMYLDFWDKYSRTSSTLELEDIISNVLSLLFRRRISQAEYDFWYTFDHRKNLRDSTDDIRRRRLTFTVRYFGKE